MLSKGSKEFNLTVMFFQVVGTSTMFTLMTSFLVPYSVAPTSSEIKVGQQLGANVLSLGNNKGIMVSYTF